MKDVVTSDENAARKRTMEICAFLVVTAIIMPALAVAAVGTYGFSVLVYQRLAGSPGPP